MSMHNNSVIVVVSMVSTLVGGGGVYLQWLDFNKKEEQAVELQKQPQESKAQELSVGEKNLLQPLHPLEAKSDLSKKDAQALNDMDINSHSSTENEPSELVKKANSAVDDLDLPPLSKDFKDFDLDKAGF